MNSTTIAASMPISLNDQELVLTRLMSAPREVVFAAFTDPQQLRRWWGPKDYPATHVEMDVRPGGRWRNCLTAAADGRELWQHGVFREVVPPSRLSFTFVWEEQGERGLETLVTISFADEGGRTRLTLRQTPFHSIAERDGHGGGWSSSFDRLDENLAGAN
jgi:uncharacterized protein YndB with AHSA1/START domain